MKVHELKPGQEVYSQTYNEGPYVLIQHLDSMIVTTYKPDPLGKDKNRWESSRMEVKDAWLVRTKKGNYLQFPASALTLNQPIKSDPAMTVVLVASLIALAIPFGLPVALTLFGAM